MKEWAARIVQKTQVKEDFALQGGIALEGVFCVN